MCSIPYFADCLQKVKTPPRLQKKKYLEEGKFPVVAQENALINGYTNDESLVFRVDSPLIVFGDHTRKLKYIDFDFVLGADGAKIIKPKIGIDVKFFYYYLSLVMPNSKGYARHYKFLKKLKFSIPPLAEQQRIAAMLDVAFERIDVAIAATECNTNNSKKLFERILAATFASNCEGWRKKKLVEITTKIGSGATPKGGRKAYKDEGLSLIRSMNVHDLKFTHKALAKINEEQAALLKNVIVKEGDVLLNITGASVARCTLVDAEILPARVNQHVSIIRSKVGILLPRFLAFLLVSKPNKNKLLEIGEVGGATRQAITKTQIEEFEISFPSNPEMQLTIINRLEKALLISTNLQDIYRRKVVDLKKLKSSLLQSFLNVSEVV